MIVCVRAVGVPADERERFLAWIDENETHQAVDYHPITRYEVAAGYLNVDALTKEQP